MGEWKKLVGTRPELQLVETVNPVRSERERWTIRTDQDHFWNVLVDLPRLFVAYQPKANRWWLYWWEEN